MPGDPRVHHARITSGDAGQDEVGMADTSGNDLDQHFTILERQDLEILERPIRTWPVSQRFIGNDDTGLRALLGHVSVDEDGTLVK